MFVRRTTYKLAPDYDFVAGQAEFQRALRAGIFPLNGLISSSHIPNEDGTWSVVAIWHSRGAADAATSKVLAEWERQADKLAGPPTFEGGGVDMIETF